MNSSSILSFQVFKKNWRFLRLAGAHLAMLVSSFAWEKKSSQHTSLGSTQLTRHLTPLNPTSSTWPRCHASPAAPMPASFATLRRHGARPPHLAPSSGHGGRQRRCFFWSPFEKKNMCSVYCSPTWRGGDDFLFDDNLFKQFCLMIRSQKKSDSS